MDQKSIHQLLQDVAGGAVSPDAALERLRDLPFENLGFAHVDHHRALRTGYPEVIFSQGKTTEQVLAIAASIVTSGSTVLATRLSPDQGQALLQRFPQADYDQVARTVVILPEGATLPKPRGQVTVISAGTSDLPVAQEAVVTARAMGARVDAIFDVGVAGIHRLFAQRGLLDDATVLVVCAGMEGALPSVVAGLVDAPVIACPTSVGYGASFEGVAALLGMLNSCATGLTVVNIDNGFGAASAAVAIHRLACAGVKDGGAS